MDHIWQALRTCSASAGRPSEPSQRPGRALQCYLESTEANPHNHSAWWRVDLSQCSPRSGSLRCGRGHKWQGSAPQDGEARANLGATYTKMGLWEQAYRSFDQASKLEYQNWRVWENVLFAAARTCRYAEAIQAQRRVVELRLSRKDHPMRFEVLAKVVEAVTESMARANRRPSPPQDPRCCYVPKVLP